MDAYTVAKNTIHACEHQCAGRPGERVEDTRWQSMMEGDLMDALLRGDSEYAARVCRMLERVRQDCECAFDEAPYAPHYSYTLGAYDDGYVPTVHSEVLEF